MLVVATRLTIDPAVAERLLDRFRVAHGLRRGALLGDLEPRAWGRSLVRLQPVAPLILVSDFDDGQVLLGGHALGGTLSSGARDGHASSAIRPGADALD